MAFSPGDVVAGYTIETVIGAGGMGTVYKARNPALPRSDALKVLSEELSRDKHFRARFLREADLAATLDHPNIVTVYTRGETPEGQLWIAMQFVDGSDADNELDHGRMTPQRAVYIVGEVGKALDYAHRRQLLHRDVKPANFLLGHEDDRVFLADFGIARALDDAVNLTQTGMVMATIAYAAPESLSGYTVDGRADIYSLGCSLFSLLTKRAPFGHTGGMAAMMAAHLNAPPPRVTDVVPELPAAIDKVIAKAMAKNPDDRYQSARELAAEAARALDEKTVAVPVAPTSPAPQLPTQAWQGPPQATGPQATGPHGTGPQGMTYAAPHASGPTFAAPQPTYPRETPPPGGYPPGGPHSGANAMNFQPRPPSGPLSGNRRWWLIGAAAAVVVAVVVALVVFTSGGGEDTTDQAATTTSGPPTTSRTTTTSATTTAPPAPPPPANVPGDALPGLLLSAQDVSERMQKPGMTTLGTEYAPLAEGTVEPPNCVGAWGPAYTQTYTGSGYTSLVIQLVTNDPTHKLAQAVAAFPDAKAAQAFFDKQVADWKSCQNSTAVFDFRGDRQNVDFGTPSVIAGVLSMKLIPTSRTVENQQCERNMTVRANVIVDVRACSPTIGSAGLSIATAIADKIK